MSPLERAARALCELDNNPPGATMDGKPLWMDYLPEVRAVVEALRDADADSLAPVMVADARHMGMQPGDSRSRLLVNAFVDGLLTMGK